MSSNFDKHYKETLQATANIYSQVDRRKTIEQNAYDQLINTCQELYESYPARQENIQHFINKTHNKPGDTAARHAANTVFYMAGLLNTVHQNKVYDLDNKKKAIDTVAGMALHDIGKPTLEPNLTQLSRDLMDEEYKKVKQHAKRGENMLREIDSSKTVKNIARNHHERPDGSGYYGKNNLSLYETTAGIVDVFDAAYSDRPYRSGLKAGTVVQEIEQEFGHHDKTRPVLDDFYSILQYYPADFRVELDDGTVATVDDPKKQIAYPEKDNGYPIHLNDVRSDRIKVLGKQNKQYNTKNINNNYNK